jgi:hypothetical protein
MQVEFGNDLLQSVLWCAPMGQNRPWLLLSQIELQMFSIPLSEEDLQD